MLAAGDDARASMEVSTHALALHRADAIHWAVAVFTNLTQDHLDFHADMEDYFLAKRRLFEAGPRAGGRQRRRRLRRAPGRASCPSAITHRPRRARRAGARDGRRGRRERLDLRGRRAARCASPLPGRFNVLNALGAVAVARALGRRRRDDRARRCRGAGRGARALRARRRGPGLRGARRLRAHARLAGERAARRPRADARAASIVVFGAGGDRDRGKRPLMGARGGRARRRGDRHLRQPALARTRRRSSPRSWPAWTRRDGRASRRPPRGDRARGRAGRRPATWW